MKKFRQQYELAKSMIAAYIAQRKALTKAGILRTNRDIISDYGEWLSANILNLKLVKSGVQKGYDALDRNRNRYEIKTRANTSGRPVFHFRQIEPKEFDYAVFIEFDPELNMKTLSIVPWRTVRKYIHKTKRAFRFSYTRSIEKDKTIKFIDLDKKLRR